MQNYAQQERLVGFEIEYVGLSIQDSTKLLQKLYSGTIQVHNHQQWSLVNSALGTFNIEMDAQILKNLAKKSAENVKQKKVDIEGYLEKTISYVLQNVVPIEIITPPVLISQIALLNQIIPELRKNKAKDTHSSLLAAFGVHINPDVPKLNSTTILSYLQAYILLNDWLRDVIKVDLTREISPYIDEYPENYALKILQPSYKPSLSNLIDDYLLYNYTRNRSLDLLPLFAYMDDMKVRNHVDFTLIKPRPTFHYRLPNTNLHSTSWDLIVEWRRWLVVEKLAANERLRMQLSEDYLKQKKEVFMPTTKWLNHITPYVKEL
ncbi:amidoligase family protein [Legionella clemsonensis]|nr:amidoligase family protein [Legionella clemsonensis]